MKIGSLYEKVAVRKILLEKLRRIQGCFKNTLSIDVTYIVYKMFFYVVIGLCHGIMNICEIKSLDRAHVCQQFKFPDRYSDIVFDAHGSLLDQQALLLIILLFEKNENFLAGMMQEK